MEWRTRRKLIYGGVTFLFFAVIIALLIYFIFLDDQPTCFDGVQNGFEKGIDCGGACDLVCSGEALNLRLVSSGTFKVQGDIHNSIAIVENPNIEFGALDVAYVLTVTDSLGREYGKREGIVDILPGAIIPIFEPSMLVPEGIEITETMVSFEDIIWQKNIETPPNISISTGSIENENIKPFLSGTVTNNEPLRVKGQRIVALVSDDEGVPVGVSSTIVEPLGKDQSQQIFFTWPEPFYIGSRICDAQSGRKIASFLGDVAIVIDRSGSMDDENINPPEPLSTVKLAAIRFIRSLGSTDTASVISFANEASIDSILSSDKGMLAKVVDKIQILKGDIQNTNLVDGLSKSLNVLSNSRSGNQRKAIVLLTDGVATRPLMEGNPDYPQDAARAIAEKIKGQDIEIYVIGLGPDVDETFLKNISSTPKNYYGVDRKESLATIYDTIASQICSKKPAIVQTFIAPLD